MRVSPALSPSRQRTLVLVLLVGVGVFAVARGAITPEVLIFLGVLVPSIILHEVSHGAVALMFGDDTAQRAGRLTLNPVAHIDPFGTIILPALLILTMGLGFGYAKPVPVNPGRMRSPRNHGLLVSLAGPAVNIALALFAAIAIRLVMTPADLMAFRFGEGPVLHTALIAFGLLNVVLAAFNLLPVPPLDGSAVIERMLPASLWPGYLRLRQYSMLVLIAVILFVPGGLTRVFDPAIDWWVRLLA